MFHMNKEKQQKVAIVIAGILVVAMVVGMVLPALL